MVLRGVCVFVCVVYWGSDLVVKQSDSSRKEGPAISLLHTLGVKESVTEGAAQCTDGVLHGVGDIVHH